MDAELRDISREAQEKLRITAAELVDKSKEAENVSEDISG